MKPLSLPAAELVATLEQSVGILTRITGGRDISELLRDLERFPEPALVPHLLLPVVHDIGPERVRAAYHSARHRHGKLNVLSLAHRFGKWESLPLILEGTRADDPRVRAIAEESVQHWVANANRSFAPLLPNQHEVIVNELRNCRFSLDDRIADEIRAILRSWTGKGASRGGS